MPEAAKCKICGVRKPKRACPAVHGDICPICCGEHREVTYLCPLDCVYLQTAHEHEKVVPEPMKDFGIQIDEPWLIRNEELVLFMVYAALQATLHSEGAVDSDLLEAVIAVLETRKTLQSGLIFESRPTNPIAANIQRGLSNSIDEYEKMRPELKSTEILKALVFLYNLGQQNRNGRPKGRMYIDLLRHMTPDKPSAPDEPRLIIT